MFKQKGGGQRPFEQCSKNLHFSYTEASLMSLWFKRGQFKSTGAWGGWKCPMWPSLVSTKFTWIWWVGLMCFSMWPALLKFTTITRNWTIFILNVKLQIFISLVHLCTVLTFEIFAQTLCFVTCGTIVRHTFPTVFARDFFVFSFVSFYLQPSPDGEFTLLTRKLAFIMFCNHMLLQFIVTRILKFAHSARNHAAFVRLVDVKLLQKCLLKATFFSFAQQPFSVPNRKCGVSSV